MRRNPRGIVVSGEGQEERRTAATTITEQGERGVRGIGSTKERRVGGEQECWRKQKIDEDDEDLVVRAILAEKEKQGLALPFLPEPAAAAAETSNAITTSKQQQGQRQESYDRSPMRREDEEQHQHSPPQHLPQLREKKNNKSDDWGQARRNFYSNSIAEDALAIHMTSTASFGEQQQQQQQQRNPFLGTRAIGTTAVGITTGPSTTIPKKRPIKGSEEEVENKKFARNNNNTNHPHQQQQYNHRNDSINSSEHRKQVITAALNDIIIHNNDNNNKDNNDNNKDEAEENGPLRHSPPCKIISYNRTGPTTKTAGGVKNEQYHHESVENGLCSHSCDKNYDDTVDYAISDEDHENDDDNNKGNNKKKEQEQDDDQQGKYSSVSQLTTSSISSDGSNASSTSSLSTVCGVTDADGDYFSRSSPPPPFKLQQQQQQVSSNAAGQNNSYDDDDDDDNEFEDDDDDDDGDDDFEDPSDKNSNKVQQVEDNYIENASQTTTSSNPMHAPSKRSKKFPSKVVVVSAPCSSPDPRPQRSHEDEEEDRSRSDSAAGASIGSLWDEMYWNLHDYLEGQEDGSVASWATNTSIKQTSQLPQKNDRGVGGGGVAGTTTATASSSPSCLPRTLEDDDLVKAPSEVVVWIVGQRAKAQQDYRGKPLSYSRIARLVHVRVFGLLHLVRALESRQQKLLSSSAAAKRQPHQHKQHQEQRGGDHEKSNRWVDMFLQLVRFKISQQQKQQLQNKMQQHEQQDQHEQEQQQQYQELQKQEQQARTHTLLTSYENAKAANPGTEYIKTTTNGRTSDLTSYNTSSNGKARADSSLVEVVNMKQPPTALQLLLSTQPEIELRTKIPKSLVTDTDKKSKDHKPCSDGHLGRPIFNSNATTPAEEKTDEKLQRWINIQRKKMQKKRSGEIYAGLGQGRIDLLECIGFEWTPNESSPFVR